MVVWRRIAQDRRAADQFEHVTLAFGGQGFSKGVCCLKIYADQQGRFTDFGTARFLTL
jgi:hypothetical protein